MFRNYDWFSDPRPNHLNEDRIDFFVNNVRYKGMVRNYHEASTEEYVDWATRYLEVATNNYEAIHSMLGENPGPGSIYDTTALEKRFLGDYRLMTGDTVAFFISNGRIYARGARLNVLFPYGRNKFFSRNNYARFDAAGDSLYLFIMAYKAGREPAGVQINRSKN